MKEFFEQIKEKVEELKNNPATSFGLIFPYFLVIGLIIGLYFISNLEFVSRQKFNPALLDTVKVMDLTLQESKIVPPVDLNKIKIETQDLLAEGETIYKTNCASCHGETGAGGGPASVGMNPAPRNFTSKDGWKNGTKLSNIYTTLQEGIAGSAMIAYDFLKPQEKFAVAHYIRKNFIPEPEADSEDDLKSLDALYNLSAGTFVPAQIPVVAAEKLKLNDYSVEITKFNNAVKKFNDLKNKNAIDAYLINRNAAFMLLVKDSNWKQSASSFKNLVLKNLENNVFSPKIVSLNDKELSQLHSNLLLLFN
ncbi:MAG: cytochrome c [Ignavibacterium sp.]|nr:cytochrome c [Ignavibacterium sp.]MDW8375599.1 cytochrome c [Ignavibacteriales bacterium]